MMGRLRGWRWAVPLVAGAAAVALAVVWFTATPGAPPDPQQLAGLTLRRPTAAPPLPAVTSDPVNGVPVNAVPAPVGDLIGNAPDLKRVFDDYILSDDLRQRRAAAQAFAACVPAFLASAGETPSPEPLIRSLPTTLRSEREAAYRALFARCRGFLGEGPTLLIELQQHLQSDPQLRQPGVQAQEDLIAGRHERIESLIAQALGSADPAALASLAGLTERLLQLQQADPPDTRAQSLARAVDAALPWVACDVGLDCSAHSLGALQLCAAQGICEGDLRARMQRKASADGLDLTALEAQRARLLGLIRSGRALGAAELLP